MSRTDEERDARIVRLMQAARAELDPRPWARARARIEAREQVPPFVEWLARPAALGASLALFVAAAGAALGLVRGLPWQQPYEVVTLTDQLIAERAAEAAASVPERAPAARTAPGDTGAAR